MSSVANAAEVAEEQAALRRVATLVASGAEAPAIFRAVAEEAGRLLGAASAATIRYDDDAAVTVGRWHDGEPRGFVVGTSVPLAGSDGLTAIVFRTGRSARIDDYSGVRGHAAAMMRQNGYGTAVAAPVVAGGRTWGLVLVASDAPDTLGLESAEGREQLNASRLRILEAGLNERRRLERNLHDGAQQRLVSLAIQLRVLETQLGGDADGA